jgi:hypothetical protein
VASFPPAAKKPALLPPVPSLVSSKPVLTNGTGSVATVPVAVLHSEVVEEPLPQYPSPEEMERMAQHTRPMVPEAMLNRIFAKTGVSFMDPKIGTLISFASQNLINDIVKEAMALNHTSQPKGQERQLSRKNLEKVLQNRGMKQLPPDPFGNAKASQ